MTLAYFLTFSTYGTWLHGSEKGSVDRNHNQSGQPFVIPDDSRRQAQLDEMTQPPFLLDDNGQRTIVCEAIEKQSLRRGWKLHALHIRTNHVHVVISACQTAERTMTDLKAAASRALNQFGFDNSERKRWSRHGSTRHLFHKDAIVRACDYVLNEQGIRMTWFAEEGLPKCVKLEKERFEVELKTAYFAKPSCAAQIA